MQCRHLNGNKGDNRLGNLCWGTAKENSDDKRKHGTLAMGQRTRVAKINEADVSEVLRLAKSGLSGIQICKKMKKMSVSQVHKIIQNKSWKHVSRSGFEGIGGHKRGSLVFGSKLTEKDVKKILKMFRGGMSHQEIHPHFNFVTQKTIWEIVTKRKWKHIFI